MSEEKFKKSKNNLAASQMMVDKLFKPELTQQSTQEMSQERSQEAPIEQPVQQEQPAEEPKAGAGMLSSFMDEIRALFKGKEDEEKKTQDLVEKHNKEMDDVKQGLTELLNEKE